MKIFSIFCLLFAVTSAEYVVKSPEDYMQYRNECVAEYKVPEDHVEEYKQNKYPDDAITHCYLKCVYSKFGFFDATTGYNVDNIYQQVVGYYRGDDLRAKIESCVDANEQGSDVCEWAYRGATCIYRNNLQMVQESVGVTEA